ncbi:AraC family transcriptional regulator [Bradyrhizobium sp. MOS003]|uniref:helix-turn-helix domain-containing protein n=1 Tax=Bradyrhizobium sp. MOS003 TaxID=2133946 RepID=UPI000D1255C1|nr:AraC family transcriptional regulator [Bradyrhizobium sp. MOS003]PSO18117.1 AraC family transcriptional regulator [Bradyrhizobium sp. MOS003]
MALVTHGDEKYRTSEKLAEARDWPGLSIEHRKFEAGRQATPVPVCNELVMVLSGGGIVCREGNGEVQKSLARPGMSYLVPVGTQESSLELSDRMECLHVYLPPALLDESALTDFDIDPAKVEIAYAHGLADRILFHICAPLRDLLHRPRQPTDALFVGGIQVALAAHLLGHYTIDRWQAPGKALSLDPRRLQRVLDYIESSLGGDIRLEDLAAQACLSPYHFSRLFREATGLSPHRYVTDRRVQAARHELARDRMSLVEIALEFGFGSQANFTRVFRKAASLTPGQYRELCGGGADAAIDRGIPQGLRMAPQESEIQPGVHPLCCRSDQLPLEETPT